MNESHNLERRQTFVGTLNYMSPEMAIENTSSLSTDLWSVGCILYKMLTGDVLFGGTNTMSVLQKILRKDIDYPFYLSNEAKDLIDSLLEINPR